MVDGPTRLDGAAQNYQFASGATWQSMIRALKIACETLTQRSPWTVSRAELEEVASAQLGLSRDDVGGRIDQLLAFLILGQARFRVDAVTPAPRAAESLRRVAEFTLQKDGAYTFNLWHETVGLGSLDAHGLILADGTRDPAALVDELLKCAREGRLQVDSTAGRYSPMSWCCETSSPSTSTSYRSG